MTGFNRVVLMGNLTRDPELRHIPSGKSVADLGLALNERYRNKNGEMAETTCFVDIVTWEKQAENCCKYLTKGSPILVEGRLQLDQWKTDDGQNRSRIRVKASKVQFLSDKKHEERPATAETANNTENTNNETISF